MSNNAMSNETDLDWLARNVYAWPVNAKFAVRPGMGEVLFYEHHYSHLVQFSREQVEARRAELQNKPSWGAVPSRANWLAQDAAGSWLWHDSEPECRNGGWIGSTTRGYAAKGCVLGDWRDTIEKRPEQAEFEPFVSVEDAKITIMQSDGDIKRFGGIIGRSLPPEEDAATAKQPAPKGSGNPILGMVLADLTNRALEGKEKYGEPLLAHNGRNPLWDAYQEALDLAMYLRQAIEELG